MNKYAPIAISTAVEMLWKHNSHLESDFNLAYWVGHHRTAPGFPRLLRHQMHTRALKWLRVKKVRVDSA
jgi:hypothetical protein